MVTVLNRNAFKVLPTKKFFKWLGSLEDADGSEDIDQEPTIYLINELAVGSLGQAEALEKSWREIADTEFEAWWESEEDWPQLNSVYEFQEFFSFEYVEMVYDLSTKDLLQEEL